MPYLYTSRWYVRNYVRMVFQGGDRSKNVFFPCCYDIVGIIMIHELEIPFLTSIKLDI